MSVTFKLKPHSNKTDVNMIEVYDDDLLVGCIYPGGPEECKAGPVIKVISKFRMSGYREDHMIPAVFLMFDLRH